ncbi:MAG: acyl-CoA dehydrogenase family protein [Pseudomonadota bacterium]|nr:acyl-CoA dehydrogenase family protein [Pseudomonadota bacterium]
MYQAITRAQADDGANAEFAAEVRAFLARELTPDLRAAGRATIGTHSDIAACRAWHKRLYRQGWIAPAWPKEHGGTGWSRGQRLLFEQLCALNDAPVLFAGGLRNVGPLLIAMGTEEQRRRYLPAILSGDEFWCQGYSEPDAGSDLVALRTRARCGTDRYVINGRKVWTTGAQHAQRMFGLVRTSTEGKPHEGITFLLIDMATPGITVSPIPTMFGEDEFNEVTFDNVEVPVADRVGAENQGWAAAKTLMRFARASNTTAGLLRRAFRQVQARMDVAGAEIDPVLHAKVADAESRLVTLEQMERFLPAPCGDDTLDSFNASMMKIVATELHQQITMLNVELAGPAAVRLPAPDCHDRDAHALAKALATRAATIYSGTNEIHRDIMGRFLQKGR